MEFTKRKIGICEIQLHHSSALAPQADWLLSYLEKMHREGYVFFSGMKIQFGWSFLELHEIGRDAYVIREPDFSGNPFEEFRQDVSVTLQIQAMQNSLIAKLGVLPTVVSFQDKIIIAKGCLGAEQIYMERIPPQPDKADSGWFVGFLNGDNQQSNLQSIYVYQLLSRPILLQFLLLPAGSLIVLKGDHVKRS